MPTLVRLSHLAHGDEGDFFALLSAKELHTTRDGKPYFRVTFRDAEREVMIPIWNDGPWADDCREHWQAGEFYKLRALYRDTSYGPQLDLRKIRTAGPADAADGFDPLMLRPRSPFDPAELFARLIEIATTHVADGPLRETLLDLLDTHREQLLVWPASRRHHHACVGGFLEHATSVAETALYLADKYIAMYPDLAPPLRKDLVVVGAILHDFGKLLELDPQPIETTYTAAGHLLGHVLLGRDLVRAAAERHSLDAETRLRLEHIIASHERKYEWGAARPPMTPEALIVQTADDLDAQFNLFAQVLSTDPQPGPVTQPRNAVGHELFRGWQTRKNANGEAP